MACVGRLCLLPQSRTSGRRYLSKCLATTRSHVRRLPTSAGGTRRNLCQEQYNEPASGYAYAKSHEWASTSGSELTTIGISNYAQEKLGDVVFVEIPEVGTVLAKGDQLGVLESVKAAADLYVPVSGTVAEVNSELGGTPDLVNKDPYLQGWLVKLKGVNQEDFKGLLSAEDYKQLLKEDL